VSGQPFCVGSLPVDRHSSGVRGSPPAGWVSPFLPALGSAMLWVLSVGCALVGLLVGQGTLGCFGPSYLS